jgi:hypothetical protein
VEKDAPLVAIESVGDFELYVDPTPLTKDEKVALYLFIKQLKENKHSVQQPISRHSRK